jgi:lipopolysaccharide export LptBFGC system permease protein LptF
MEDPHGEALAGILILQVEAGRLVERWDAERLVWSDGAGWVAEGALHRRFTGPDGLVTARHPRHPVPLAERPEDFVRSVGLPERLALSPLLDAVGARARLGQPTDAHRLELYRRAAQPLTLWLAVALGAAAMLGVGRRPTLAGALGVGASLGFSLWILDEVAVALASTQAVAPGWAAAVPPVVVGAAAVAGWLRAYRRGITD